MTAVTRDDRRMKPKHWSMLTALAPVYYLSKAFFVASFSVVRAKGRASAVTGRRDVLYSLAGLLIYAFLSAYFVSCVDLASAANGVVPSYIFYVKVAALLFMMYLSVIMGLIYRKTITEIFSNFETIDGIFQSIKIELNYQSTASKLVRKSLCVTASSAVRTATLAATMRLDLLQVVLLFVVVTSKAVVKHQFTTLTSEVRDRYVKINTTIETSFLSMDHIKLCSKGNVIKMYKILFILCRTHYKLRKTIHYIINSYSLQLLIYLGVTLSDIIFQSYLLYAVFSSDEGASWFFVIYIMTWLVDEIFELFTLVATCTDTSDVAAQTAAILHKLTNKLKNNELENHIQMYSLQMLHQTIQFSVLGFVVIDNTLLYSMIGAVTTYLVILIQFNQAQKNVSMKNRNINGTELE